MSYFNPNTDKNPYSILSLDASGWAQKCALCRKRRWSIWPKPTTWWYCSDECVKRRGGKFEFKKCLQCNKRVMFQLSKRICADCLILDYDKHQEIKGINKLANKITKEIKKHEKHKEHK